MNEIFFILGFHYILVITLIILAILFSPKRKYVFFLVLLVLFLPSSYYFSLGKSLSQENYQIEPLYDPYQMLELEPEGFLESVIIRSVRLDFHEMKLREVCLEKKNKKSCYRKNLFDRSYFYRKI